MTKEQIYKSVLEYVDTLDENDRHFIYNEVEAERVYNGGISLTILSDLLIYLKSDIRADCAKANGSTNSFKAAMDIIKAAKKKPQTALHGAWMVDNKQCVCDGYRVIRFNSPLDLPGLEKDIIPMDVKQIFSTIEQNREEYPVPSIGDLKTHIALEKAKLPSRNKNKATINYDIGAEYPLVDAEYLLTMITGLENCRIYWDGKSTVSVMYCVGDNGDGGLCPIWRKREQNDEEATA